MRKTITLKTDGGKERNYPLVELDFVNILCDLEDKDIPVYSMAQDGSFEGARAMNTIRVIFSTMIGEKDLTKAGKILSEHIRNGGSIDVIFEEFSTMMGDAGFGGSQTEVAIPEA